MGVAPTRRVDLYIGRNFRLTDVHGKVVHDILT